MNIEAQLELLIAALAANTDAHSRLADVAMAATGGKAAPSEKPAPEEKSEPEEPTETAAAKKKRLAAEKKKAAAAAAAAEEAGDEELPELVGEMAAKALHTLAAGFMAEGDSAQQDENKANFVTGLAHLGAKKFSELETDEDRARLAGYITYWQAGLDVDFKEIDGLISEIEGDDPMG